MVELSPPFNAGSFLNSAKITEADNGRTEQGGIEGSVSGA
jgi:hypothetical protein